MVRLKPHGCRRRGHQEGGGNTFSGYVGNDDLNGVRVDGDIVVVIATYAPRWLYHTGHLESGNDRFALGKKQALNLHGQLHVLEKVITLPLHSLGKRFPLFHIPRGVIVMEQDTNDDKAVADLLAQKNSTDG